MEVWVPVYLGSYNQHDDHKNSSVRTGEMSRWLREQQSSVPITRITWFTNFEVQFQEI